MSAPAFGENNKQKNKKSVAWIGLGAGAILAGVIGIFTWHNLLPTVIQIKKTILFLSSNGG
jgi:hypothetical protein